MSATTKTFAAAAAVALAASLAACSSGEDQSAPMPPVPTHSVTSPAAPDPAYAAAIASYPRRLPEGYQYPANLVGAEKAGQWWWCSQIDAAWEAYFRHNDEDAALGFLRDASQIDPGSYGAKIDLPNDWLPSRGRIERTVRFIDGGVDSQYLEDTASGCWQWARKVGSKFTDMP